MTRFIFNLLSSILSHISSAVSHLVFYNISHTIATYFVPIKMALTPDFCSTCEKQTSDGVTLSRCSRCKTIFYCSIECQKIGWKANHKKECAEIVKLMTEKPKNPSRLPDDLWDMLKMEPVVVPIPKRNPGDTNDPIRDAMEKASEGGKVIGSFGLPSSRARNPPVQVAGEKKSALNPPRGLSAGIEKPFERMEENTWLHGRAKGDVYQLLIDTYRLRMIQEQQGEGQTAEPVYPKDPVSGFKTFLEKVEAKRELLPEWWTADNAKECIKLGEGDGWSSLAKSIRKSDVIEHYGDQHFGVQLRFFGEQVYGTGPAEMPGVWMLPAMKMMEESDIWLNWVDEF